jgi:endothelin-converting enzyme
MAGPDGKEFAVNGEQTLGENIADNGGTKKAFEAWLARYRSDPRSTKYNNKRLPGLEKYTPEQMFFVQYARSWCTKSDPTSVEEDLLTNVHAPAKWRIIGVVQNSEYFAKTFQCKAGAPMNPVKKCDLW